MADMNKSPWMDLSQINGPVRRNLDVAKGLIDVTTAAIAAASAANVVTQADLDTLEATVAGFQSAWTPFACTLVGSVSNPNLGTGGTLVARAKQVGKTVHWNVLITCGSVGATAGSGTYTLTIPVVSQHGFEHLGAGWYFNGTFYHMNLDGNTSMRPLMVATANQWGSAFQPIANGNIAAFGGTYEAA